MQKSRLLELFKSLDKVEVKKLRKWVRSPFFNQREDVILLFDYLDKNRPFEKLERLDRQYIFSKIFPKENYDEKKIGYAQSFLMAEIKKFIAYQEFTQDEMRPQIYMTRNLRKRGLNRHFESEWKNANELLEKQPLRNADFHFYNFQLQNEQHEYANSLSRKEPKGLQEASDELTNYFVAKKLKLGCDQLNAKHLINADYQQEFLEKVLTHVTEKDISDSPAIQIYYEGFRILSGTNDISLYKNFRFLLNKNHKYFPKLELKYLYLVAINFCIKQHNAGNGGHFTREAFNLYKEGLRGGAFLENGFLTRFTYKNIVSAANYLKEFEWVEKFIYEYKEFLDPVWKEDTFNYCLAIMFYSMPNYDKAMKLLQTTEFKDKFLQLNARILLIKMYFHLKEYDALESLLDSFTRYLSRHNELGYHKNQNLNFVNVVRKLIRIAKHDKTSLKNLKIEVEQMEVLFDKKWILKQFD